MHFVFRTTGQITFGSGAGLRAPEAVARFGRRVLLVTGAGALERSGYLGKLEEAMALAGLTWTRWAVEREPEVAMVDEGARLCREFGCEAVLAVGGGSVLDAGKAVSGVSVGSGSTLAYLEDVPGQSGVRPLAGPPLPLVCVPTTFGTGSEVTRNAVIKVREFGLKRSMRDDRLVPRAAMVDPDFGPAAPRAVAAAAGMDALTHLLEAYSSTGAQPTTDALALSGIRLIIPALWALAEERASQQAWEAMALASLWGGMALANAGLGAVHGLVAPLGGRFPVPHGAGCASLLPAAFRANVTALRTRGGDLRRFEDIAAVLAPQDPTPEGASRALDGLRRALAIPSLGEWGIRSEDFAGIVAGARGSSMRTNPVALTDDDLMQILAESL